ncbi:hypothetical protein F511_40048 [Dorcoceras hygrometricum]|uniref:Uncharacterized protein n=1 Tax=Dorcoceras hygrometricum TaxID=472368 RepID=A0A2Z7DAY4_9LAMI|nr:hypothetical protein F511_40048 [Dorcoceras hygrometricum]
MEAGSTSISRGPRGGKSAVDQTQQARSQWENIDGGPKYQTGLKGANSSRPARVKQEAGARGQTAQSPKRRTSAAVDKDAKRASIASDEVP